MIIWLIQSMRQQAVWFMLPGCMYGYGLLWMCVGFRTRQITVCYKNNYLSWINHHQCYIHIWTITHLTYICEDSKLHCVIFCLFARKTYFWSIVFQSHLWSYRLRFCLRMIQPTSQVHQYSTETQLNWHLVSMLVI